MSRMGLPDFNVLQPSHPVSGWVAISDRSRLEGQLFHISYPVNAFAWLSRYSPVARVGRTINLYHIPETDHQMSANDGGFETPAHPRANLGLQRSSILSVALSAQPIIVLNNCLIVVIAL